MGVAASQNGPIDLSSLLEPKVSLPTRSAEISSKVIYLCLVTYILITPNPYTYGRRMNICSLNSAPTD